MEFICNRIIPGMEFIRYDGKWYKITPKPYEPERQTTQVAWMQVREPLTATDSYRKFFDKQRKEARILYPSFRKDAS